jgi:uncharacterized protein (TIRG00374 family)
MDNASFLSRTWTFLKKPVVSLVFRIAVSAVLLGYLIKVSAFTRIAQVFSRIEPIYLLAFFILYFFSVSLQAIRWKYLLKAWDLEQRFGALFRIIMIGLFLNNFFPGSLGGDAFRLYSVGRNTGKVESVAATIFYERILSYASLVTLGLIALSMRPDHAADWLFWLLLGGALLGLLALSALSSVPIFERWANTLMERYAFARTLRLSDWLKSFQFKVRHPVMLIGVLFLSFLIQFTDVFSFRVVAASIQLPVTMNDLLLFVPLLYLAILLPLSVNGIGVRESVFVIFASTWGISSADAVAFSLTVFVLNLAGSLVGGIMYWFDRPTEN